MKTAGPCPLCGSHTQESRPVDVCTPCYRSLQASGAVAVTETAEIDLRQVLADVEAHAAIEVPGGVLCTWCQKPPDQVKKMLLHQNTHLCNECISLAVEILEAELGNDWR